ncbi:MAG TPA: lipopolysaccharide biosynthesis protein [Chitinophagaceae bacterium]|nr:lipopolysaccharide biosynthesis protein [Chitinophagaceae bacterium]HAN38254.1 lipopolysaccharide biosynthesis protein [Chitinophagaceae bacterium]
MEFANFFRLLYKQRYTLVLVPIVTVVITYFLTRNLPNAYVSKAQIGTGLVDQSQVVLSERSGMEQESRINQEFNNLIQTILNKRIIDQVGYRLIIHDITDTLPYKEESKLLKALNAEAVAHAIKVYSRKYNEREPLNLGDEDQKGLHEVMKSMGYDEESLQKKLMVYRLNGSDFIQVEFEANDARLSAAVVNAVIEEFINYYTSVVKENQLKAVNFLDSVLRKKEGDLNKQVQELRDYKIRNRVLNLSEQAKQLYEQIKGVEDRRQQLQQVVAANKGALKGIDGKFDPISRKYVESALVEINQQIVGTKNALAKANDAYVRSNFAPEYKYRIDSLQNILEQQIQNASDKYISNPLASKDNLVSQKIGLEVAKDVASNGISTVDQELARLNRKFDMLMPHEAVIQQYENNISIASAEYIEILKKYNQTSLDAKLSIRLRQVQKAQPGTLIPSKKMLLVVLSGMISFVFCIIVLFVLFYLDHSVKSVKQLANDTGLPVLGETNMIQGKSIDLTQIWNVAGNWELQRLKDQTRAIRYEIDQDVTPTENLVVVSSIKEGEGRTFVALNLAYAYAAINKSVLLLDGNFSNPSITQFTQPAVTLNQYIDGKAVMPHAAIGEISVMGNEGGDITLFEMEVEAVVREKIDALKKAYDVVIVEAPPLKQQSKSKEWVSVADRVVAIFQANQTVNGAMKPHITYYTQLGASFCGFVLNKSGIIAKPRKGLIYRLKQLLPKRKGITFTGSKKKK